MAEQNQADRAEVLEKACWSTLVKEVSRQLVVLTDKVQKLLGLELDYTEVIIKLALYFYIRNYSPLEERLRFRGKATEVFVTQAFDMLPVDALKNFRKYNSEDFRKFIEAAYAHVDAAPFLEPPADYRPE